MAGLKPRHFFYAVLGPVTGPLVAGIVRHWKHDRPLALLYALACTLVYVELPFVLHALVAFDLSQLQRTPLAAAAARGLMGR